MTASIISPKLWGGISVAYPAEIPVAPLTNKFGKRLVIPLVPSLNRQNWG